MLSLARNTNNITLTNPLSFNLPTLNNIIQKLSASNIEHIFNSTSILNTIGTLRIKNWLLKIWQSKPTIDILNTHYRKTQNFTLIFHLCQLAKQNISLSNFLPSSEIFTNYHTIYEILSSKLSNPTIASLRNNKILFLEQIITADNLHLFL